MVTKTDVAQVWTLGSAMLLCVKLKDVEPFILSTISRLLDILLTVVVKLVRFPIVTFVFLSVERIRQNNF